MSSLVVEIHVPLTPVPDVTPGEYAYPWILDVEDRLTELEDGGRLEVFDDGEEDGEEYVFFITGASQEELLRAASRIATGTGVPAGAYAVLSSDDAEGLGLGERVDLPVPKG